MKVRAGLLAGVLVLVSLVSGCTAAVPVPLPAAGAASPMTTRVASAGDPATTAAPTPTPSGPALPQLVAEPATAAPSPPTDPPARFAMASVGLDLPVVAIGVGADGQLSLPPDPSDIGWYRYGPTVGVSAGSTLLAGHLDSLRYGLGPLVRLRQVGRGDLVVVTTASGRADRYKVSDVQRVRKADLVGLGVFDRAGSPLLRIVTCGGPFDPRTGYRDNLVFTATPVT